MWLESLKKREIEGGRGATEKNIWRNNAWKFSRFGENCKSTDSRISVNPKHEKHESNYIKAIITRLPKTDGKKVLKAARGKRHVTEIKIRVTVYFS